MEQEFVVFDLDGTLVETEQIWRDVRRDFTIAHGGHWGAQAQVAMMGMRTDEWAAYMHDELGVALAPSAIAERVVARVVERLRDVPVLPGADAALERLAGAFRLGLATSAAIAVAKTVLAVTGWRKHFAVLVSADEVERGKPAPDVYDRAVALLGAAPSRSAAVEDSAAGIRSADAAGLAVIAIPNREFPPDEAAFALTARVIPSLDALAVETLEAVLAARGRPETAG